MIIEADNAVIEKMKMMLEEAKELEEKNKGKTKVLKRDLMDDSFYYEYI